MNLKEMLIKEGIVKIKNKDEELFTLKSGRKSRLFIDIKQASLNPEILEKIVDDIITYPHSPAMFEICKREKQYREKQNEWSVIGSVAIGAVPIASVLSVKTGIKQVIIRSEKHDRGTQSQVIGDCKDKIIFLIEDVATSGESIVSAVKAIRDAGGVCNDCLVIVDRQEGAYQNCKDNKVRLFSLIKKSDFGINENILKGD